jgi:Cu(I)/Ag(I) efflux system protein CusF
MKRIAALSLVATVTASGAAIAQAGSMKGMQMEGMDKNMMQAGSTSNSGTIHKTSAVVKAVDPAKGMVTLAHGPVQSLKWPAMTMGFSVKDKALFDRLSVGKKVDVEFMRQGSGYVVTAAK